MRPARALVAVVTLLLVACGAAERPDEEGTAVTGDGRAVEEPDVGAPAEPAEVDPPDLTATQDDRDAVEDDAAARLEERRPDEDEPVDDDERTNAPDDADGAFRWQVHAVPDVVREEMVGVSWEEDCPVAIDDLRLVEVTHHGFDGEVHAGELMVNAGVVEDLERVFAVLFDAGFPLERVDRIETFGGDDDAAMAANATTAFNCRRITGGERFSEHSYGTAIDLNPIQNPYERDGTVLPPEGEPYLDRSDVRPGMIVEGDAVVGVFDELGWEWGGRWHTLVDHMHFELPR